MWREMKGSELKGDSLFIAVYLKFTFAHRKMSNLWGSETSGRQMVFYIDAVPLTYTLPQWTSRATLGLRRFQVVYKSIPIALPSIAETDTSICYENVVLVRKEGDVTPLIKASTKDRWFLDLITARNNSCREP